MFDSARQLTCQQREDNVFRTSFRRGSFVGWVGKLFRTKREIEQTMIKLKNHGPARNQFTEARQSMRHIPFVFVRCALPALLFLASNLASDELPKEIPGSQFAVASASCFSVYSDPRIAVCVSDHGNVRLESPIAVRHVDLREGYVVCASFTPSFPPPSPPPPTLVAWDAGISEAGWVGAPVFEQPNGSNSFPLKIERVTNSGLKLTQTFARDVNERDFTITMNLGVPSGVSRFNVRLDRYFDADINNTASGDRFDRSQAAVWAADSVYGLTLTDISIPFATTVTTAVHPVGAWQRAVCGQSSVSTPTPAGDYVGRISYNFGTLVGPTSRTVVVNYRRM
jgi:hypothetical protein